MLSFVFLLKAYLQMDYPHKENQLEHMLKFGILNKYFHYNWFIRIDIDI